MDKKGVSIFLGLMMAVIFFVLGLAVAPALKDVTQEAMNDSTLNCSTATSQVTKAVCTSIDVMQWFVAVIFGIAGIVVVRAAS